MSPSHLLLFFTPQIVAATGSGVSSFGLTEQGDLLAWGTSKRGQLGLGAGITHTEQPQQLRLPAAVVQVSAGWGHAAALLGGWGGQGGAGTAGTWPC